jgi:RimJ/RimL family protein N-acetyltransferase
MREDTIKFSKWLEKEYISKWFCSEGGKQKDDWLNEINNKNGEYNFIKHFIINIEETKIGFCQYFDGYFWQSYFRNYYGITVEENNSYEIDYFIGEEKYLNKGFGKIIVKKLEEKIIEIGGKEIFAGPHEENTISIKTLLSNGFIKIKDGDYRKKII